MKQHSLALAALLAGCMCASGLSALSLWGEKAAKPVPTKADMADRVDTVAFWTTVINLLEKNKANPEFVRHAQSNLQRVETRRAHAAAGLAGLGLVGRKGATAATTPKAAKHHWYDRAQTPKAATAKKGTKDQAYLRGKKAGEAHERRLLQKKEKKAEKNTRRERAQKKYKAPAKTKKAAVVA